MSQARPTDVTMAGRLAIMMIETPNVEFRPTHAASSREVAPGTEG
jgi:hypothetical protein